MNDRADSTGYVTRTGRRVAVGALRSLELLDAIERTVGALASDVDNMRSEASLCEGAAKRIAALPAGTVVVDPGGSACDALASAITGLERVYKSLTLKRQAASDDPSLHSDDGVVEAFDNAMEACLDLHDSVQVLKDAFEEVLADSEPVIGRYDSAEQVIDALRKG